MNPNNNLTPLDMLANGYIQVPGCATPIVVQQTTAPVVQQISTPAVGRVVDLSALAQGTDNESSFTFTNNTAVDINYWFTTLWMRPGTAQDFGVPGNSAFDFLDALGTASPGVDNTAGGARLQDTNQMALSLGGFIVGRVTVTGTGVGSPQSTQELTIINQSVNLDPCTGRILPGVCDACFNNGGSTTFTKNFCGPIGYGGLTGFGYTVLAGQTVTLRLAFMAQGIGQFEPLVTSNCNVGCGTGI